ncbi:MAG: TonB-dependent receptor [Pseudomonadales bacterium]|nr:TonB-dependent receptor [Pseudomonadales bacterium]
MKNLVKSGTMAILSSLPFVFIIFITPVPVFAAEAPAAAHNESIVEEIIVTSPFGGRAADTALPISVLSGEELREKVTNSLGDTLKNEIGIANGSFGPGVGQPIIRGQTGNRVSVLQNGVGVSDASNISPDHANGVEAVFAERLEVIRGPATLLYGNGAIGGVVNVIDNRIPERLVEKTGFVIDQSHNSVNDQDKTVLKLDAAAGNFGFHLDAFHRESNNVEVDGFAIDEAAVEVLEALAASQAGEEPEAESEDEFENNTRGFIGNSDAKGEGVTGGFSYVTDKGFFGFSISELENDYGLPPGAHGGHDEEAEAEEEEEEVEFVRIDMDQTRYDFKGMLRFADSWIDNIKGSIGLTDYEHKEIEITADGERMVGTRFENDGLEGRFTLTHAPLGNWSGVWGLQFSDSEFSAIGEEAFIPESDISDLGLFAVERFKRNRFTAELGFRVERNSVDPSGRCDFDGTSTSVSGSLLYELNADSNILFGLARSERAPAVEELFSNISTINCGRFANDEELVLHAATGLIEIGNSDLDQEVSSNIEIGLRKHSGRFTGELSAYYNEIDDYIFLDLADEEFEGQPIANYLARDATFTGIEGRVSFNLLEQPGSNLIFGLFGDLVRADFDSGGDVPRIPPAKFGAELRYFANAWSAHLHVTRVQKQDNVGNLELKTDGYTQLALYADYHMPLGSSSDLTFYLRGDNLLDEEIRNHASFLKNFAPEPGRSVSLGIRFTY